MSQQKLTGVHVRLGLAALEAMCAHTNKADWWDDNVMKRHDTSLLDT